MGFSPYIVGGIAQGVGQGVQQGVGTMVARRKEEMELRRQAEKEKREERRIQLAEQRAQQAHDMSMLKTQVDIGEMGGVIEDIDDPNDNGTGRIGYQVGVSSASTQPSEHQGIPMREVGRAGGKRFLLPADGLKPADRVRLGAGKSRAAAAKAQRYYQPTPEDLEAIERDPTDAAYNDVRDRDWALNPANINAQAQVAGARAAATYPYKDHSEKDADGLTPAQRAVQARTDRALRVTGARVNEVQARQDVNNAADPKKADFGFEAGIGWQGEGADSAGYAKARTRAHGARTAARLRAAEAGAEAESATYGEDEVAAARRRRKLAYQAYVDSFKDALTPEEQAEALSLYRRIERESLAIEGRTPTIR